MELVLLLPACQRHAECTIKVPAMFGNGGQVTLGTFSRRSQGYFGEVGLVHFSSL